MSRFVVSAKKKLTSKDLSFIILAAGPCKKYKTKSLFQIRGITLIEHQIEEIRAAFGNEIDIIICLGHEFDKIYKHIPPKVRVIYNENYLENTSAFSLLLSFYACITDNCYIVHGDIFFNRELFKLSIPETHTFGWPIEKNNNVKVGIICQEDEISNFQYDLPIEWKQLMLFTKKDINNYKIAFAKHKEIKPQLFEIINEMIDMGSKIKYIPAKLQEVNSNKDLL